MPSPPVAQSERRSFWVAAGLLTGVLVVLIALFVAFYPRDAEQGVSKQAQVDQALNQSPHIIPKPSEGRAPDNPGDPGGWEQLALLGLVVAGLGTVAALVWRSSRRARANDHLRGSPVR